MRLFVAVDLSTETRAELARLRELIERELDGARQPPRLTWVKPEIAHLTLEFIGEVSEEDARRLVAGLDTRLALGAFTVKWRTLGTFPASRFPRVLWLGAERGRDELESLARHVRARVRPALQPSGTARAETFETRPFKAHVTLARIRDPGRGVDWRTVLASVSPIETSTIVDRVTLYRSQLSPKGPTYTALTNAMLE